MHHVSFADPSDFASTVPPVPDVKAWLQEFRTTHPHPTTNSAKKYEAEISSLNARHDTMRMEFQAIETNHNSMLSQTQTLRSQLTAAHSKVEELRLENTSLRQQHDLHLIEISALKQKLSLLEQSQMSQMGQSTHSTHSDDRENRNQSNIQWNFANIELAKSASTANSQKISDAKNVGVGKPSTASTVSVSNHPSTADRRNPRKRGRHEHSTSTEERSQNTTTTSADSSSSAPSNPTKKVKMQRQPLTTSVPSESYSAILEKRLPTQLDMIRGDILAEAAGDDQIAYCFSMLKKCTTDEWQLRNFLMQMIRGLCGEIVEDQDRARVDHGVVYDHRHVIKKQLADLRSTIVKSTCDMLVGFSEACEAGRFGQVFAFLIPTHLTGLYVTIACIR